MYKQFVFLFLFAICVISIDPPLWPQTFSQQFILGDTNIKQYTVGKLWYDSKNKLQRIDVKDARINKVCTSVSQGMPTQCTRIYKNGIQYVWLPERSQCCKLCTEAQGCVIAPRDWLKNFTYVGQATLSGQAFYKWTNKSAQGVVYNYFATQDAKRIPRRIQVQTQHFDMIMNTYSTDAIAENVFNLPSNCNSDCPKKISLF